MNDAPRLELPLFQFHHSDHQQQQEEGPLRLHGGQNCRNSLHLLHGRARHLLSLLLAAMQQLHGRCVPTLDAARVDAMAAGRHDVLGAPVHELQQVKVVSLLERRLELGRRVEWTARR
ncbi:hypothetical protein SETIT_9G289200v2 [Setaria italica]|uniref:Uncharacterized protein n=1 Tax=Setaria italica TaxID=4555 RepID=A0A368SLY5_SETIT|nr:hypothetical protein SETIT_9G289200v2 [Setaria italica]